MRAVPDNPPPPLTVTIDRQGRWVVLVLAGDLDWTSAPYLGDRVAVSLADQTCPHLVLEVSAVEFCDTSGLNAVIGAYKRVTGAGGRLVLVGVGGRLARLLHLTGLDRYFTVADTLPD